MASASNKDIEDFEFIIEEIVRLKKLLAESYDDFSNDFDNPFDRMSATVGPPKDLLDKSKFQLFISNKANEKLFDISERVIKSQGLGYYVKSNEFNILLRESIYRHVYERKPFDRNGYTKILNRALKKCRKKGGDVTYIFPIIANNIDRVIDLGAAKVIPKEELFNIYPGSRQQTDDFIKVSEDSKFLYNAYVSVHIPQTYNDLIEVKSKNVLNLVVGIIHLHFISMGLYDYKISTEFHGRGLNYKFKGLFDSGGLKACSEFQFSKSLEGFWGSFEDNLDSPLGDRVKELIMAACMPTMDDRLVDRLIDSILWFCDASYDTNEHSQLVKLVTSMERLVTMSSEKGSATLSSKFSDRVSNLNLVFHPNENNSKSNASKLYSIRSDLVHGTKSLYKSLDSGLSFSAITMTAQVIFSAMMTYQFVGLSSTKYEDNLIDFLDVQLKLDVT
ncbi:HEPN domain-containing protein [Vibrio diabolicus]|uniref:HEPN domain-containing protein n=1 Tax=Vibrio diabolicus TaxID=50719 RepID=UPI0022A8C885|nr:HEPN domain-containing protein [Vibrio diabolicus]MCZ0925431.1 HEPN domain-containing protein [Vibrio diabolicus]